MLPRPSCIENLAFSFISTFSICDRIYPPEDEKQACQGRNIIVASHCTNIIRWKNVNYNWFSSTIGFPIIIRLWTRAGTVCVSYLQILKQISLLVPQVSILQCLLVPADVTTEKQKVCPSFSARIST